MKKKIIVILSMIIFIFVAGCNSDKDIASVNGEKITEQQLEERSNIIRTGYETELGTKLDDKKDKDTIQKIKDKAFNDLVLQALLRQEAEKQDIKVSDKEVNSNLDYFKQIKNQTDKDGYNKFLKSINIDEKKLRQILKDELLYQKMEDKVTSKVDKVTDAEIKKYYDENKAIFTQPEGIQIYHILVNDKNTAQKVIEKLKGGTDFASLAKEYSIDPSKDKGGDVGTVNETTGFVEEFKTAALKLKPGEYTLQPVKTEFGYHVIKAGDKKPASITPFEEVKDSIKIQLESDKKVQVFGTYLEGLRNKADIKDYRKK